MTFTRMDESTAEQWQHIIVESMEHQPRVADRVLADSAADFKTRFKISLADAFAAALVKEQNATLATGDPEFKPLEKEIDIRWLRVRTGTNRH